MINTNEESYAGSNSKNSTKECKSIKISLNKELSTEEDSTQ